MLKNAEAWRWQAARAHHAAARRTFLVASTGALAGTAIASQTVSGITPADKPANVSSGVRGGRKARSTILFFLSGGASHLDMWDLKPHAPLEYRGPFQPISTSAPGVVLSEHLPMLARQAHHLALINSVGSSVKPEHSKTFPWVDTGPSLWE